MTFFSSMSTTEDLQLNMDLFRLVEENREKSKFPFF